MVQLGDHGVIVESLRRGSPNHAHYDGDFRATSGRVEHQVLRAEHPNRLVLFCDNQEKGACRHHECRGFCQDLIVLDELHGTCHNRPDFDVVRFESLSDDFLYNVGRRHEAELRIGILDEQAGRLLSFEQQRRLADRYISRNLHDPWRHHMGNHGGYEPCCLEGPVIVDRHGFETSPDLRLHDS